MSKKRNSLTLTVALLTMAAATNALAEGQEQEGLVKSPFTACKDVKLVAPEEFEKNKEVWEQRCKADPNQYQILPQTGMTVFTIQEATNSYNFLMEVANKSIDTMEKRVEAMKAKAECFSPAKEKDETCVKTRQEEIDAAYKTLPEVRRELALADGEPKFTGTAKWDFSPKMLNSDLEYKMAGLKGLYRAKDHYALNDSEKKAAEEQMKKDSADLFKEVNSGKFKSDKERKEAFNSGFATIQAKHKEAYFAQLQKSPVLLMVGKLPADKNDTKALNKQFSEAYHELVSEAQDELKKQKKVRDEGKASVGKAHLMCIGAKAADKKKECADQEGTKDLLRFMTMASSGQIAEQILQEKKDPHTCAIATALYLQNQSDDALRNYGVMAGIAVGASKFGTWGGKALMRFAPFMGASEAMATAAGATGIVFGPVLGGGFAYVGQSDFERARGSVAGGAGTMEALNEAEANRDLNVATFPLDFLGTQGGAKVGSMIYNTFSKKTLAKLGLKEEEIKQLMKLAKSSDANIAKKAKRQIDEAIKKAYPKIFGRNLNETEVAQMDEMAENGYLPKLLKNLEKLKSDEERVTTSQKALAMYQKMNSKALKGKPEVEEASQEFFEQAMGFAKDKPEAEALSKIPTSWAAATKDGPDGAKSLRGAASFMNGYNGRITKNAAEYSSKAPAKSGILKEAGVTEGEEKAMRKQFEEMGMTDAKQQDEAFMCLLKP